MVASSTLPMQQILPDWTVQQQLVIEAPQEARQLVIAGPGTGKTAVACARVAWLAAHGVTPSAIMMFSFTRAAVAELRNRILMFSGDDAAVLSVRISTLDSQAWHFRYGTGSDFENLGKSFDENIEETIRLLEGGNDVLDEYLEATSHLIIDESQDLTAARARLVSALIRKVPSHCGVTVFADPCQAIYGFTNDFDDGASSNGVFLESFDFGGGGFTRRTLDLIHRTQKAEILSVFDAARTVVDGQCDPIQVVSAIQKTASPLVGELADELDDKCLVLYRRRAQALMDAHYYPYYCRLRMSGLPACIHPWIGAVLWRFTGNVIQLEEFIELWEQVTDIDSLLYESIDSCTAWNLLHRHAGERLGGINLVKLRELLCRTKPHADFLIPDYGMWGPIFGTIHGSKGREAENVVLMLPRSERTLVIAPDQPNADRRNAEEARVYYVGATRAQLSIEYAEAKSLIGATSVDGGRVWHRYRKPKPTANVQFGLAGDIDELALVRRDLCGSAHEATTAIESLMEVHRLHVNSAVDESAPVGLFLSRKPAGEKAEWRYRLCVDDGTDGDGQLLGWLTHRVGVDLFAIAKEVEKQTKYYNLKPPTKVVRWNDSPALKMIGIRTVAVPPDQAETLHEPFRSSGFLLAPIVFGYPQILFRW